MNVRNAFYNLIFLFQFWLLVFANYGILEYIKLRKQEKIYKIKLETLKNEHHRLSILLKYISNEGLDIDLLETQVRKVLALARKNEEIYFWK